MQQRRGSYGVRGAPLAQLALCQAPQLVVQSHEQLLVVLLGVSRGGQVQILTHDPDSGACCVCECTATPRWRNSSSSLSPNTGMTSRSRTATPSNVAEKALPNAESSSAVVR